MGCGGSSQSSRVVNLPQEPPYAGPPVTYNFVNLEISSESTTESVFCPNKEFHTLTENLYLPALTDLYNMGYKMLSFAVTTGSMTASGFTSVKVKSKLKAQGIFRKMTEEEIGKWKLVLAKSCLPKAIFKYSMFNVGSNSQPDHIFQTIANMANDGGRLVSIEVTGGSFVEEQTASATAGFGNMQMNMNFFGHNINSLLGVDLFFDMPTSESSERYQYQVVPLQMTSIWSPLTGRIGGTFELKFDWQSCVHQYLSTGWKLVEVFLDQNTQSSSNRTFMASKVTLDVGAMFIFEKPNSRLQDNNAVYEVKMVEYRAPGKLKMAGLGKTDVIISAAWESMLENMGKNGWEVVRILQTPSVPFKNTISTSPEFEWIHYVYFQRLIMAAPEKDEQQTDDKPPEVVQVAEQ